MGPSKMRLRRSIVSLPAFLLLAAGCAGPAPVPASAPASPFAPAGAAEAAPTAAESVNAAYDTLNQEPTSTDVLAPLGGTEEGFTFTPPGGATTTIVTLASPASRVGVPFTPPDGPRTDTPLYDLPLTLLNGETLRLSDLKGNVVVLNFWASWCPPCRWEMPAFEKVWQEYRDKGVVFVGIAVGDVERDAREFAEGAGITYPLGLDSTAQFARKLGVLQLPTTFLFDRQGNQTRKIANVANEGVLKVFLAGLLQER